MGKKIFQFYAQKFCLSKPVFLLVVILVWSYARVVVNIALMYVSVRFSLTQEVLMSQSTSQLSSRPCRITMPQLKRSSSPIGMAIMWVESKIYAKIFWKVSYLFPTYIRAATCDFQQCDILTCVDSNEPVQRPFKLINSKWCSVSSLTLKRIYKGLAKALIRLRLCIVGNLMHWLNYTL